MTDLLHTLPDFPTRSYTHLIPSLEKNIISTTDLITLDPLEIAKRAQLPLAEVKRLANHVLTSLQSQLGLSVSGDVHEQHGDEPKTKEKGSLRRDGLEIANQWSTISTLEKAFDAALGGGIPLGYITEITGESGAGKTQILLNLLLSAQLSSSHNSLSRPSVYISTEHSLPTPRLAQLLRANPLFSSLPPSDKKPSLAKIFTLQTPDLESQDHILTYQLPVLLARHKAALVVIDSIAANYRAERNDAGPNNGAAMAARAVQLVKLGAQLRDMARTYDCAIVVSNQVADRFAPASPPAAAAAATVMRSPMPSLSPPSSSSQQQHLSPAGTLAGGGSIDAVLMGLASSPTEPTANPPAATPAVAPSSTSANLLTLDHQMNFFTGWSAAAAAPPSEDHEQRQRQRQNLKTPSLGLVWANQIACRIALVKSRAYGSANDTTDTPVRGGRSGGEGKVGAVEVQSAASRAEWTPRRWRRWMKVVFAPWVEGVGEGKGVEFEIYGGGIRAVV